jgi:rhamnose transport system ATP-binding protein
VHAFVAELVSRGVAVILVSSDLPEVMGIADRIVVMHQGRVVVTLGRSEFDAPSILAAALGGSRASVGGATPAAKETYAKAARAS